MISTRRGFETCISPSAATIDVARLQACLLPGESCSRSLTTGRMTGRIPDVADLEPASGADVDGNVDVFCRRGSTVERDARFAFPNTYDCRSCHVSVR
jgi:hypothetical protein